MLTLAAPVLVAPMPKPTGPMQVVLNQLKSYNAPPVQNVEPRVAREAPDFSVAVMKVLSDRRLPSIEKVQDVTHRLIPGPNGRLLVRIYRPLGSKAGQLLPGLVYFHGGGFVLANLNTYDASCRALANMAGYEVMSVAYREAPEHKYPAPFDDALAATKYLMANARGFGVQPGNIAIGGESVGGNLTASTCISLKKEGAKLPTHQLIIFPVTDWTRSSDKTIDMFTNTIPLNSKMLPWFKKFTFANPDDAKEVRASPYLASTADLKGLPPVTQIQAEIDPLRQQGLDYAAKLKAAGVPVQVRVFKGVTHEFFGMGAAVPQAKAAESFAAGRLRAAARMRR